ncbi:hypothetical protein KAR91_32130 [Candidatus Pacearchaeota archaeon]|nr:hypothetical protein [Candidatus Pacearchaeota archaeon]
MKQNLKAMVRGCYDIQKIRIATGNRIVANFRSKLGLESSEKEKDKKEASKLLKRIRKDYKLIADGIINLPSRKQFRKGAIISEYAEMVLVHGYLFSLKNEEKLFKLLDKLLYDFPIWNDYLFDVLGVGPAMAGVIISEIDIEKPLYPSSIWKYAGLDVAGDGKGRSRKKEHLVKTKYINKDGEEAEKNGITFNPFLKTKLIGVLGPSFLRCGVKSPYAQIYYEYKNRLENSEKHKEKTKLHRHNMANRYMIKRFLVDLYKKWRKLEGLPVADEYSKAKLGIEHKKAA